jgi:hypothetical protein
MANSGYSGTPLAKKLGIKPKYKIRLIGEPAYYFDLFTDWPADAVLLKDKKGPKDLIHYFVTEAKELAEHLALLKEEIQPNGTIWVSWYKKSAKILTDVTEDVIRQTALKIDLVDVKVCAIDEKWSGLKLVIPLKHRKM